jgi:hypothetical protein
MFPLYEEYYNTERADVENKEFDFTDLDFSFTKQVQLCAFNFMKDVGNGKIIVSNKLKNVACLPEECVNLHLGKLNKMTDYKYSIKFDKLVVHATAPFDDDKYLATASIDKLKKYLPENLDLDINKDLMGVAFDAFVVNRGNKNGHIINTDVALSMVENFINKPFNIEHNRKVVVGVCTGYGFSEFGSSKPLTIDDIKNTSEPFNVVLSGYIWKIVNPDFADELLNSSDPSSDKYLSVSASWELGFNEFNIAKGSKNLSDAKIVDSPEEIDLIKSNLKVFGGNGYSKDGEVLFLNLQGSVLPLGIGFTNTPAAEVSGVLVADKTNLDQFKNEDNREDQSAKSSLQQNNENIYINKLDKKSVHIQNKNVKKIMEIKTIEDINDDSMKEVAASEVRDFIANKISDLSKEWELKVEEKENAFKNLEARNQELETKLAETLNSLDKLKLDFEALNSEIKQKEIEATFQNRMSSIDEEFNLTDEDRAIIAEDLQSLASEEDFEKWMKKFSTFAAAKKKIVVAEVTKSVEKVSEVSASEKTVEEIVSSVEAKEEVLPNASTPQQASLVEKINAAFNKNSIKIK